LVSKLEKFSEVINEVIRDYDQMKQTVRDWVVQQQQLNNKVRFVEEGQRNYNILIFGLQEEKSECYMETLRVRETFVRNRMKAEIVNWNTEYVKRLGR
jgi:hypothetical protein